MRTMARVAAYAILISLVAGCAASSVTVPRQVVDMAAKLERTLASDQVVDLTENLDAYLAAYAERYAVSPRRAAKSLWTSRKRICGIPTGNRFPACSSQPMIL